MVTRKGKKREDLATSRVSVVSMMTTVRAVALMTMTVQGRAVLMMKDLAENAVSMTVRVADSMMMTVHAAKGLEFPRVALCSLSEGVFPTRRARTAEAMEEERRLCFVALTRAKDELCLTQAAGADFEGTPRVMSRFLLDIDPALLDWRPKPAASLLEQARERLFEPDSDRKAGAQNRLAPGDSA